MARPTKLTPQLERSLIRLLEAGNYREVACRAVGIDPSTLYRWLARGEEEPASIFGTFRRSVERAEAEAEVEAVAALRTAVPDDWRAAMTYLERKHPSRWRRRQTTEVTGAEGRPLLAESRAFDLSRLTDEELALLRELRNRAATE